MDTPRRSCAVADGRLTSCSMVSRGRLVLRAGLLAVVLAGCPRPTATAPRAVDAATDTTAVTAVTPSPPDAQAAQAAKNATGGRADPLLRVASFDCEKYPPLPGQPEPKGLVTPSSGIRAWNGGGPDGASWNVDDLRCTARIATICRAGTIAVTARVGRAIVGERVLSVSGSDAVDTELIIPAKTWRRHMDQMRRKTGLPFTTAIFRLLAEVTCKSPEATPGEWRFTDLQVSVSAQRPGRTLLVTERLIATRAEKPERKAEGQQGPER